MISTSDFIKLPFTPDLTESGIAYATRTLAHGSDPGGSQFLRLRRSVSAVAVELAFRRYLVECKVPFDIKRTQPFSDSDRYDVTLGGHRCNIQTNLTSKRNLITVIRNNPGELLQAPALIPEDQLSGVSQNNKDLYLFAFLLGFATNSVEDIQKALNAGQKIYPLHPLRTAWSHPEICVTFQKLSLKSEATTAITVEIGGLDANRNFITEKLTLSPSKRSFAENTYYSLAYIHTQDMPETRVGLHSPDKGEPYLILPHEWDNIWIYGLEIWLTGYMDQDEFRHKASTSLTGSRIFQYSQTRLKSLSMPVKELHPLDNLFKQVKNWEQYRKPW